MAYPLLARKISSACLGRQNLELRIVESNGLPREEKSAKYQNASYEILLATKGSFMRESDLGIIYKCKTLC